MIRKSIESQLQELNTFDQTRRDIVATKQSLATQAGYMFEEMAKTDFNLNAIEVGSTLRACTDRTPRTPIQKNDPVEDIRILDVSNDDFSVKIQAKAQTPKNTYVSFCRPDKNKKLPYTQASFFLCTKDSFQYADASVKRYWYRELYRAENGEPRWEALRNTEECISKLTDSISIRGVNSTPWSLTEVKAEVNVPWYSSQQRQSLYTAVCSENATLNLKIASQGLVYGYYAIPTAAGNYFGAKAEASTVILHSYRKNTGCFTNAAVNAVIQSGCYTAYGRIVGQTKAQIISHVAVGVIASVAGAFCENPNLKDLISAAALETHRYIDQKYKWR